MSFLTIADSAFIPQIIANIQVICDVLLAPLQAAIIEIVAYIEAELNSSLAQMMYFLPHCKS